MPNSETIIQVSGVAKSYGARRVLNDLNLEVRAGEIVGLLGPNGAGKTTTLSILASLQKPDAGKVRIAGYDLQRDPGPVRHRLGFVPQSIALYPSLTALQNVELFARIHGLGARQARESSDGVLDTVGLTDRKRDPIASLSGGMQRRVNLACGMVHHPEILLLDEPTVGVDPQSRERILETLRALAAAGATIVYSTHYMEEVERLCDRALLIDHGHVIAAGTVAELVALGGSHHRMEITFREPPTTGLFAGLDGVSELDSSATADRVNLALAGLARVSPVLDRAARAGFPVLEFKLHSPNLSDAFMSLTGHALRDTND
ncbi:MAG TPA: ABC transporter ATP-binding protein [Candidatus Binataceae bacterium]|nr:ABC transporter ATP-binding protein [Candidatus Binataceae bacterium]